MKRTERPPIVGRGIIVRTREPGRLFDVRMPNGHVAVAVVPRGGLAGPSEATGVRVEVAFSPYDMSRCKVVAWQEEAE